ncbi:hypothetical protein AAVH_20816 [Aphelenchoides avenae]|nr:hypothetical protein AAVH_20816 [Aphelenchus avenae]
MKAPLLPKLFSLQPLGPAISTAECAELRRKIVNDPSKRFSRADGARIVQEFLASGVIDGGMFSVPFKLLSLLCPINKPFWDCPICQKRLPAEDLRMDEFTSYVLRVELDGVHSVEVCQDGSHRAVKRSESSQANSSHHARPGGDDAITLDDEPMVIDHGDRKTTEGGPLVKLPLSLLLEFNCQTKNLLSRLPVKKGKRKADDPADLLEEHHDALRKLVKQARATRTNDARVASPQSVHNEALVTVDDELRAQNEELTNRNSALLTENLRMNQRIAELEQNHAKYCPDPRVIAATRKNTAEVLMWLDRFSLDAVQFTCTRLKAIVVAYLPVTPMRVLKSVAFDCWGSCSAKLNAREDIEKRFGGEPHNVFRRMFALCSGCAIEYMDVNMAAWTPTIRAIFADNLPLIPVRKAQLGCPFVLSNALLEMMKGLESVHIRRHTEAIDDGTMRACAKRGVARLSVWNGDGVTEEALLDFCFSNTPTNGDATERTLFMRFFEKRFLSKNFLRKLVKKCLDQMPKALPSVTLGCVVDTTSYERIAKTHFKASGEKFEIVVRKRQYGPSDFNLRKGHADIGACFPERYFCDWDGWQIYL